MRINAENATQAIELTIDNLLVVPPLFTTPKEGWVKWATNLAGTNPVGENTISGTLIRDTGPSWAYGLILPYVLTGEYEQKNLGGLENPEFIAYANDIQQASSIQALEIIIASMLERSFNMDELRPVYWAALAKISRMAFEQGQPLYIGVYRSIERYKTFTPVLTYLGDKTYQVDWEKPKQTFTAEDHKEALYKARQWFIKRRDEEIQLMKDRAGALAKKLPAFVTSTAYMALVKDESLYDNEGSRLAWKRQAHGLYGAQGYDWCYIMSCSNDKAAQMAIMAILEANQMGQSVQFFFNFRADLQGKPLARYYSLEDFLVQPDGSCRWKGGEYGVKDRSKSGDTEKGLVSLDGKPLFAVMLKHVKKSDEEVLIEDNWVIKVIGADKTTWVTTTTPHQWAVTREDALAWAIRYGLNFIEKRRAKES